jgi:potassium-transporting ATPase KdpC subunit
MKTQLFLSLKFFVGMTILTGIIYPIFMTGVAQVVFPGKANGSLVLKDGRVIGSELIGQKFDSAIYFWSRPSAIDYNPVPSSGSNLGPTSGKLRKLMLERRKAFAVGNSIQDSASVPKEMIFASASGLDPHISPEAAFMQIERVVSARNFNAEQKQKVLELVSSMTEKPQFLLLGEGRINVFELNLAMDNIR